MSSGSACTSASLVLSLSLFTSLFYFCTGLFSCLEHIHCLGYRGVVWLSLYLCQSGAQLEALSLSCLFLYSHSCTCLYSCLCPCFEQIHCLGYRGVERLSLYLCQSGAQLRVAGPRSRRGYGSLLHQVSYQ